MTPLAHAGHWLTNVLYLAPVALVAGFVLVERLRGRRP